MLGWFKPGGETTGDGAGSGEESDLVSEGGGQSTGLERGRRHIFRGMR